MLSGGGTLSPLRLPLLTLQLVHSAVELPVEVGFVAEKFVSCIRGRQAEASAFRVWRELLASCGVFLQRTNPFKLARSIKSVRPRKPLGRAQRF